MISPITIIRKFSQYKSFIDLAGNTPLLRLNQVSEETGCNILAKVEFMNGGGSIKDRPAKYLIQEALNSGKVWRGGTIVEGTAGNTGIGLAHMARAEGLKCVFYMPDAVSHEKIDLLKTLGAEVFPVPIVPYSDPNHYNRQAENHAKNMENAFWTNQFDNTTNRQSHYETTGPEIWKETDGKLDAIVFAAGTGGTVAGVSAYMKERNPNIKTYLADPQGSINYNWIKHGRVEVFTPGPSLSEGIGQARVTDNLEGAPIDDAICVLDKDMLTMTLRLLDEEGLFVGGSSGLNIEAAVQIAKIMGKGHTIVTALCDGGERYFNKLFSIDVLKERGLYEGVPDHLKKYLH